MPSPPGSDDEAELRRLAAELADGVDATIATWVVRSVTGLVLAWSGHIDGGVAQAAEEAGQRARREVGGAVRTLLQADIDAQWTTPLALLRMAVRYPTGVLAAAGIPAVQRDRFAEEAFPDDVYDLTPASLSDIDPSLADPGLSWGAAKAWVHKRRHLPPG